MRIVIYLLPLLQSVLLSARSHTTSSTAAVGKRFLERWKVGQGLFTRLSIRTVGFLMCGTDRLYFRYKGRGMNGFCVEVQTP